MHLPSWCKVIHQILTIATKTKVHNWETILGGEFAMDPSSQDGNQIRATLSERPS